MLNGAGILHGGCIAYLIDMYGPTRQSLLGDDRDPDLRFDSCCSTPLIVLGHVQGKDGMGVTQNMNISYHAPVAL